MECGGNLGIGGYRQCVDGLGWVGLGGWIGSGFSRGFGKYIRLAKKWCFCRSYIFGFGQVLVTVLELRGNNLGKTIFFVGKTWNFWCWCSTSYEKSWELRGNNFWKRGNNLGITWRITWGFMVSIWRLKEIMSAK